MIKMLAPALRHPSNRDLGAFQSYWRDSHGPLFANTRRLRRYVQHLTLPELYGDDEIRCTYDGCSLFWYDDLDDLRRLATEPRDAQLWDATMADDRQLFDRSTAWPTHHRFAMIIAREVVLRDETGEPGMVKALWTVSRMPGVTPEHFFRQWSGPHAELVLDLPGLHRYVQNHALPEAHAVRGLTHDGFSEMWFDDLAGLRTAMRSPTWEQLIELGRSLFAVPIGSCVAIEKIQKEIDLEPRRWARDLSPMQIEARLTEQGYTDTDRGETARRIHQADASGLVAVWTDEHLVVLGDPVLDRRPTRES